MRSPTCLSAGLTAVLMLGACGGGGGESSGGCPSGQVSCASGTGTRCVDPLTDRSWCGADAECQGGQSCGAGELCVAGACATSCPADQVACGEKCVDPMSDAKHCGVGTGCTGGHDCGEGSFCQAGGCWSPCQAGQALCDGSCIDPTTNRGHCGAAGVCGGSAAGLSCPADQVCTGGACACPKPQVRCDDGTCQFLCEAVSRPAWEWKASVPLTAPPRFAEPSSVVAHIVFDGTEMVDLAPGAPTRWTRMGAPGSSLDAMWSPEQALSGPFSASDRWVGDELSRTHLLDGTAGPFTVCARYKPGAHPMNDHNKVIVALGKPEAHEKRDGDVLGGWAVMQMHESACFHYSGAVSGEWMAPSAWPLDGATMLSLEWVWQCGGWDGTSIRGLREATAAAPMDWGGTSPQVAGFPAGTEPPSIGAYFDGTAPLSDGGVYEVIITGDPATRSNMRNLVARASGGLRTENEAPVPVIGADGATHLASPATVRVETNGSVLADQTVVLGATLPASPAPLAVGQCWGVELSSPDWTSLQSMSGALLQWTSADESRNYMVVWNTGAFCMGPDWGTMTCQSVGSLEAGSLHTFRFCINPDRTPQLQHDDQPAGTPGPALTLDQLPVLTDPASTFWLLPVSPSLEVWRVWACAGSDPASCR